MALSRFRMTKTKHTNMAAAQANDHNDGSNDDNKDHHHTSSNSSSNGVSTNKIRKETSSASPTSPTPSGNDIDNDTKQQNQNQQQQQQQNQKRMVQKAMWAEARAEALPLTIGAIALVASSTVNQKVPKLLGQLMELSPPSSMSLSTTSTSSRNNNNKSNHTTTTDTAAVETYYFVSQIVWLGVLGGMASFVRTYTMSMAQETIAARLRSQAFASLLLNNHHHHDLEWFQNTNSGTSGTSSTATTTAAVVVERDSKKKKNTKKEGDDDDEEEDEDDTTVKKATSSTTTVTAVGMTPAALGVILKDDVDTVAKTMTTTIANLLRSSSSCLFGTYHMLAINPQLVGLSLVVAPLVGAVALASRKYLSKLQARQQQAAMHAASFVDERLQHLSMVQASNRQDDEIRTYNELQQDLLTSSRQTALANGWSMGILFSLGSSALCGILLQGRRSVLQHKTMTSGQLTSFGTYSFLLALGTAGVVRSWSDYRKGVQSGVRLYSVMRIVPPSHDKEHEKEPQQAQPSTTTTLDDVQAVQSLSVDKVDFAYQSHPTRRVLQNLSLQLSRGEVVALVGKNGSGKSTVASLLTGLYQPTRGAIHVVQQQQQQHSTKNAKTVLSISDLDRPTQAQLVQVVPQQPVLFNMSVLENVRYSRPTATEDQVLEALASAHGKDFVLNELEGQLHYAVGRNGCRLSGGQRQKVALARAFLADPLFLVLDEPNSAMDAEAELALNDTLQACRQSNRGLLIITHRAKTLEIVNRVVVLKEGTVVEEGTLDELQRRGKEFVELMPELE